MKTKCQNFKKRDLMLARGTLLHKSASFKIIPEQYQTNQKNYANFDTETILKIHQKSIPHHPKFKIWAPILEPVALIFKGGLYSFADLIFGTSGGYPLGLILASPGAPLV